MAVRRPLDATHELSEAFEHSSRVSEYLIDALPPRLWRNETRGRVRTIAAIVAHMQSVRRTFARMAGGQPVLRTLDQARSTPAQARRALQQSREVLTKLFRGALGRGDGRVKGMPRRTVNMMIYLMEHDAHHRGQICMLARMLGYRLTQDDVMRIWGWKKLP